MFSAAGRGYRNPNLIPPAAGASSPCGVFQSRGCTKVRLTASRIAACHSVLHGSGQQHMPMWPSQIPDCQIDVADMFLERLAAPRANSPCRLVRTSCRSELAVFQHCTSNLMERLNRRTCSSSSSCCTMLAAPGPCRHCQCESARLQSAVTHLSVISASCAAGLRRAVSGTAR